MIDWVKSKITETAVADRVDPALALSVASIESGFNPDLPGDTDTPYPSYGVFQERIVVGRGGFSTPDTDVARQTHRFDLDVLAYLGAGGSTDPGAIAAAVQRPLDQAGYAAKVDALYPTFLGGSQDPHGCPAGQVMFNGVCGFIGRGGFVPADNQPGAGGNRNLPSTVGRPGAGGAPVPGTTEALTAAGRGAADVGKFFTDLLTGSQKVMVGLVIGGVVIVGAAALGFSGVKRALD